MAAAKGFEGLGVRSRKNDGRERASAARSICSPWYESLYREIGTKVTRGNDAYRSAWQLPGARLPPPSLLSLRLYAKDGSLILFWRFLGSWRLFCFSKTSYTLHRIPRATQHRYNRAETWGAAQNPLRDAAHHLMRQQQSLDSRPSARWAVRSGRPYASVEHRIANEGCEVL